MHSTKLRNKISLVLFGILLSLVLLEVGLRLGGFIFLTIQELSNKISLESQKTIRILCLGESTTALGGSAVYPRQLENILNSSQDKIKFKVINKAIPSITTDHIIANLQNYLAEYKPNIVTAMIGINDGANYKSTYDRNGSVWPTFWRRTRIYKFFKLMGLHLAQIRKERNIQTVRNRVNQVEKMIQANPSSPSYTKLAGLYRVLLDWDKEAAALQKAIQLDPTNAEAYGYLGLYYRRHGEYVKSAELFRKAVDLTTDQRDFLLTVYAHLAEAYTLAGDYEKAEAVHREAMQKTPGYLNGYYFIGDLYLQQGRYAEAAQLFRKQLDINPASILTYGKKAFCLRQLGSPDFAEGLLREGVRLNPKSAIVHAELASHLIERENYAEAEQILKKALSLKRDLYEEIDINLLDFLITSYEKQGKTKEAQRIRRIIQARQDNINFETFQNYQNLQETLAEKKILLVAVQYPMRPIDNLKGMLNGGPNKIIIDNETSFRQGVEKNGYDYYFIDRFAGDFGHCTPAGHRLIAENIAHAILEYLKSKD